MCCMEEKKPIKLYFFVTVLLLIATVYFGLVIKDFLSEKFLSKEVEESEETVKENVPKNVRQSRAVFSVAGIIFVTLITVYVLSKILTVRKQ